MPEFCKQAHVEPKQLLDREMTLLEGITSPYQQTLILPGLHFHLKVYHPYRALHGFITDLQDNNPQQHIFTDTLWSSAKEQLDISLTTDLILLYPPAQLALAALLQAAQKHGIQQIVDEYVKKKFSSQEGYAELSSQVGTIGTVLNEAREPPSVESIKAIDRKLRFCTNPELNPQSEEYRANKAKRYCMTTSTFAAPIFTLKHVADYKKLC